MLRRVGERAKRSLLVGEERRKREKEEEEEMETGAEREKCRENSGIE